ncbi:hypothetical protein BDV93DRAFT_520847 [Ceratobasidium sp. AG-I]|nr:hypothetical protein BDV93DRAFT_520847 [Ceratobasidium sp. AG-I]
MSRQQPFTHILKQLKFIGTGGLGVWFFDIPSNLQVLRSSSGYAFLSTQIALGSLSTVVALFLYLVLYLPRVQKRQPDYARWNQSPELRVVIPILMSAIIVGWTSLVVALARGSPLGIMSSIFGATGTYALTFGLVGLIPVPTPSR